MPTETSLRKTHFFVALAHRIFRNAPQVHELLQRGHVLGNRQAKEVWKNVAEHSLVQAAGCSMVAKLVGLPEQERHLLEIAAMVHDHDKQYQAKGLRTIQAQIEAGAVTAEAGGKLKYDFFEASEEHSIAGMRAAELLEPIIELATADGHPALPRVMQVDCPLPQKILHYVGSITEHNTLVLLDQRINRLESDPKYKMMNEYGRQVAWTGGRTLYEVQRVVGHQIEAELAALLLHQDSLTEDWQKRLQQGPTQLPCLIREKIQKQALT